MGSLAMVFSRSRGCARSQCGCELFQADVAASRCPVTNETFYRIGMRATAQVHDRRRGIAVFGQKRKREEFARGWIHGTQ